MEYKILKCILVNKIVEKKLNWHSKYFTEDGKPIHMEQKKKGSLSANQK